MKSPLHPITRQRGFSLVEVLIALIILSVGMLGIASLFVNSMSAGRTSMFRHHAVTLAGDVADRIRANPRAQAVYLTPPPGANQNCVGGGIDCDEAQMALNDIWLWSNQAQNTLPNGQVTIALDNALMPPVYTIRIDWDEPGEDPNQPLQYTIQIPVLGL